MVAKFHIASAYRIIPVSWENGDPPILGTPGHHIHMILGPRVPNIIWIWGPGVPRII